MKKFKQQPIPDLTEFTDEDGKKWKQTSTDDLFSMKELNTILESIEKERNSDEIIFARIDFQKVNREYYETGLQLQKKLKKQTELLKEVILDSKKKIERKNRKLKELIDYIKKLHLFIAYLSKNEEAIDTLSLVPEQFVQTIRKEEVEVPEVESTYEDVEEIEVTL